MKTKKTISLIMAIVFVVTMMMTSSVWAAITPGSASFTVTDATVDAGGEVSVAVKATANLSMFGLKITYDTTKLTFKSIAYDQPTVGETYNAILANAPGVIYIERAEFANLAADDMTLCTITFDATAVSETTTTSVGVAVLTDVDDPDSYPEPYAYDGDMANYPAAVCTAGTVTITSASAETPNVASVGAIADAYVLAGTDYATAKASFPATAAATFDDDSTANVNVTWPETLTYAAAGEYVTVTGAIAASDAYTNTGSVAPSFKLYTIPETVAMTIDGLDPTAVASKVGTAANVALTYDFADGVAEFAYVVTNEEDTASAPTDDAAWSTAKTFSFAADDAHGTVKKVTAFVKIGDQVVASTSGTILKCNTIASGTVYVNATVANPTFSALRVNKAAGFTATSAFKYANDAEHSFVGTTTYALYPKFGAAQDVAVATNTDGTFDDIAALANGAYTVKATYTEEGFETIEATRTVNIGSVGLWYSAFTINDKTATQNIKATATNKINFTVDTMDGLDVIYTGAAIVPYGDVVADKALTETASVASEYVLDFAGLTGRTYSVYALAKKDNTQPYYDFALAKTVYLKDAYTNAYSVSYNGTGYCDAGHQDAITFAARCAGPQLAVGTVTYEYSFEKWDAEAGAFVAATVNDTETVLTDDATNAGVTVTNGTTAFGKKNRVTLTVKLNGEIDNVIQKIFYN